MRWHARCQLRVPEYRLRLPGGPLRPARRDHERPVPADPDLTVIFTLRVLFNCTLIASLTYILGKLIASVIVKIGGVHIENQFSIVNGIRLQPTGGDCAGGFHLGKQLRIAGGRLFEMDVIAEAFRDNIRIAVAVFFPFVEMCIRDSYLSYQARRCGSRTFTIPFDRQQLADYLNVDRSALSNELGKMQKEGLLQTQRSRFVLLCDEEQLPEE